MGKWTEFKMLSASITLEELYLVVAQKANSKSPGADSLPGGTYLKYSQIILRVLLETLNDAVENGHQPSSMNEAIVVVRPKPGKDPLQPDSYRPFPLLNSNVKLLAWVLATRLAKVISRLVHLDQSGFILARSTALNIQRLFLINIKLPVDEWQYLWDVLHKFTPFIYWIQLLYAEPKARIRVNYSLSEIFPLY